jgi:glycerophosphoryl diester phosphodiesterase
MICIGHRGARGHEPENTLRSVRRAIELGADGIEIDVYFVEGELVVFHDTKLERTTNGRGRLTRKSFQYLRALDAGNGEQIPTLGEVFDAVNRRAFINVELKGRRTAEPVAKLIEKYVRERGWSCEEFLVSSFHRRELRALADGPLRLGVLFARSARRFAPLAVKLGAFSIHPGLRWTNQRLVRRAHALGLKVFVYTVNDAKDIARMSALGVDGVFTDFPERVKAKG